MAHLLAVGLDTDANPGVEIEEMIRADILKDQPLTIFLVSSSGLGRRAKAEGKQLGRPRIAPELEARILTALKASGRTEGVRKIAKRFAVDPGTVQRISRPLESTEAAYAT